MLQVLIERMMADDSADAELRGFVSIDELLSSLESAEARRVRRLLVNAGIGDLLESRPGHGYRLRGIARAPTIER